MLPVVFLAGTLLVADRAPSVCSLGVSAQNREGTCSALVEGADAHLDVHSVKKIVTGQWRPDVAPISVWSGTIATNEYPKSDVEIEIYGGGRGVMRTELGWYPVTRFSASAKGIRFDVDPDEEVKPSSIDLAIVLRASKILSNASVWNRADNRKCPEDAHTWSIYCAMEKATIEVSGAFHHRRPALEIVRQIVDERTKDRPYDHRLMDYNNDETTKLADVQSLFSEAMRRMKAAR